MFGLQAWRHDYGCDWTLENMGKHKNRKMHLDTGNDVDLGKWLKCKNLLQNGARDEVWDKHGAWKHRKMHIESSYIWDLNQVQHLSKNKNPNKPKKNNIF